MIEDEVLFTPQLATVVVELYREISSILDEYCGISYLEFCLLASLRTHQGVMSLADFPTGLCSNVNTVIAATTRLDEKGLCVKTKSPHDKRMTLLNETKLGNELVEEGFKRVYDRLRLTVWKKHSDEEINDIMYSMTAQQELFGINLREVNNISHPVMTPAYFMGVAIIFHRFTDEVRTFAGLSFNEYRCLALLESRPTPLTCSKVAETLLLDRSSITSITSTLKKKKLIEMTKGEDRRSKILTLTEKGQICSALVTARLGRATAEIYAPLDPEMKSKTNELHMRMFSNYAL